MAEAAPVRDRRLPYIISVAIVLVLIALFFIVRSCETVRSAGSKYVVVFSNLELKDAANVVAKLKDLKIPYEIRDEGRTIAVPRDRADQARLGLAEAGLPVGGVVGWEIFDTTKLGATDFDRRVQFIRAISGELARTIRRIDAIDDTRVQIVIPETKLFEAQTAPVTASVLIKLKPGKSLSPSQVQGIIHLVASSVENLKPENVTIVDIYGNILSGKEVAQVTPQVEERKVLEEVKEKKEEIKEVEKEEKKEEVKEKVLPMVEIKEKELVKKEEEIKKLEEALKLKEKELTEKIAQLKTEKEEKPKKLTQEEMALLRLKLKKELEDSLASNAQKLLNKFYPPNTVIVSVNIEAGPPKVEFVPEEIKLDKLTKKELTLKAKEVININKLTAVVLVDNRVEISKTLKKDTFQTVAGAIGYSRARGDRILLKKVPFHYAISPPKETAPQKKLVPSKGFEIEMVISKIKELFSPEGFDYALKKIGRRNLLKVFGGIVLVIFGFYILRFISKPKGGRVKYEKVSPKAEFESRLSAIKDGLSHIVESEPERITYLIEKWLSEES